MPKNGGGLSVDVGVSTIVELTPGQNISAKGVEFPRITITLEQKAGQTARLRIKAPPDVSIVWSDSKPG